MKSFLGNFCRHLAIFFWSLWLQVIIRSRMSRLRYLSNCNCHFWHWRDILIRLRGSFPRNGGSSTCIFFSAFPTIRPEGSATSLPWTTAGSSGTRKWTPCLKTSFDYRFTYLRTGLVTYLMSLLDTYLMTCLVTYLPTYLPTYIPTFQLTCLVTHMDLFSYLPKINESQANIFCSSRIGVIPKRAK